VREEREKRQREKREREREEREREKRDREREERKRERDRVGWRTKRAFFWIQGRNTYYIPAGTNGFW
jgi:hypothetical protein